MENAVKFVDRIGSHDRDWHGISREEEIAEVEARDAAIRKECADIAIGYLQIGGLGPNIVRSVNLDNLRAVIMGGE